MPPGRSSHRSTRRRWTTLATTLGLFLLVYTPSRCCGESFVSSSGSAPLTASPWWEDVQLVWGPVEDDHDWLHRDTGVTPGAGETYLVEWTHYNRTGLLLAAQSLTRLALPWTQGRLRKHMRAENSSSFTLHYLLEESAVGHWVGGPQNLHKVARSSQHQTGQQPYYEQRHLFQQTPRRLTRLPVRLPDSWPLDEAATSRITLCGKGVVSGPRFLPNDYEQSAQLLQGDYFRFEFLEVWLTLNGGDGNRKLGLFVEYDGCTGELQQLFLMRQARVPPEHDTRSNNNNSGDDDDDIAESLDTTQSYLTSRSLWPILPAETAEARSFRSCPSMSVFLQARQWTGHRGIAIHLASPSGKATRCATDTLTYCRPVTSEEEHELYYDVRCPDGVYCFLPKTLHPTHLAEDVCIELGCVTEKSLQRIVVCGKRSQGCLNRCVYEEWGHGSSEAE